LTFDDFKSAVESRFRSSDGAPRWVRIEIHQTKAAGHDTAVFKLKVGERQVSGDFCVFSGCWNRAAAKNLARQMVDATKRVV
jgi:hypothetical protein